MFALQSNIVELEPWVNALGFHSGYKLSRLYGQRLDGNGRPRQDDRSEGRFLACRGGFYDPEVFKPGREVTVTGRVDGHEQRNIGEFGYRYPRVQADVIYLWPERRDVDVIVERVPFW